MKKSKIVLFCITILFLKTLSLYAQDEINTVTGYVSNLEGNCIHQSQYESTITNLTNRGYMIYSEGDNNSYPLFRWPLQNNIASQNMILHNYVDNNPSSGITDYANGTHSYNGHKGTDISVIFFREMDRGIPVYAAAPGTVTEIHYSKYDRRITGGEGTGGNFVLIKHADGTFAYYYHLKKNSVTVAVGEQVPEGRIIGYVGSSGNTDFPHLHFEPGLFDVNSGWTPRDPFSGVNNPFPSLWQTQQPYAGTTLRIFNLNVYVKKSVNNNDLITGFTERLWREGLQTPVKVGLNENQIAVFILYQNNQYENMRLEVKRPDGTTHQTINFQFGAHCGFCFTRPTIDFSTATMTGTWYVRLLTISGNIAVEQKRTYFEVAASTVMNPRFYATPSGVYSSGTSANLDEQQAGKVFRRSVFIQRDTLRIRKYGQAFTNELFYLINAPANVTLTNDSILTFGTSWPQPLRVYNFKVGVIATFNNTVIRDTAFYTLIDPTKPHTVQVGIEPVNSEVPGVYSLGQNYPNPFNPMTNIKVQLPNEGFTRLAVFDITGREVAILVNTNLKAGVYNVDFDASHLSSGLYFYRMTSGEFSEVKKMVLIK